MPEYLTVSDFLANDSLLSKKIASLRDGVDAVQAQVGGIASTLKNYISETDLYRIETNKQLSDIRSELTAVKQVMERGFALVFAQLGIQP